MSIAQGPLAGFRIIELAGIGPGPFAALMLSDMGADVIRVDRLTTTPSAVPDAEVLLRGRRSIALDLKTPDGVATLLELVEQADALIEPFRPGVTERLGVGPHDCLARNPRLVYGRMTGWGQDGPLAHTAGHDINYIALAGALFHFGRDGQPPTPPLNLVGDFGGGGMLVACGVLCGLLHAQRTGEGQVVDAAMVDGAAALMAMFHSWSATGYFDQDRRGTNLVDSGAHFYDVYETSDGEWVSIGSNEPQFYELLLQILGLEGQVLPDQMDRSQWPAMTERFRAIFKRRTRSEWCEVMEGTDVCFAPVLRLREAVRHPHNLARGTFVEIDGITQPAPAPRFSKTPAAIQRPAPSVGEHTADILADWLSLDAGAIGALQGSGAIA